MECPLCRTYNDSRQIILKDGYACISVNAEPLSPGHMMVFPKRHVMSLDDLTSEESISINKMVEAAAKRIMTLFQNPPLVVKTYGRHSTQKHIHYHVLPSAGNIRQLISKYENLGSDRRRLPEGELEKMAEKLRFSSDFSGLRCVQEQGE